MAKRCWGIVLAATLVCGTAATASAGGFSLFVGGGVPVYAPPVVYAPPPVVYGPAPVVYGPGPAYGGYGGYYGGYYGGFHRHHAHFGPRGRYHYHGRGRW